MASHTRSTSLPTISHPFVLKAEEELNKLKAQVASHALSYEIILDAIKAVGQVYESINDLLCTSSIRNGLSHSNKRSFVNQELEESIKLIDICSTSRDNLDSVRGQLQEVESALRRGESEVMKSKVREYIILVRKANKDIKKLPAARKSESTVVVSSDVGPILLESREITHALLQSIFSLLPKQIVGKKISKWSGIKRLRQKSRVTCEEAEDHAFDITTLEVKIEGLDSELEILFRHLVKCRVSLLNIFSL